MTYTLFEWLKENSDQLTAEQPDKSTVTEDLFTGEKDSLVATSGGGAPKEPKKEKLTKSQKRKLSSRVVCGELPRGHDWVDVIKHLLQSGSAG